MPTLRQERLAEELANPANLTKTAALLAAGYSDATARKSGGRQVALAGAKRARQAKEAERLDSARGLAYLGQAALEAGSKGINGLEPRDQLAFGIKALETAHNLGESVHQVGDGTRAKERIQRACRLMARLTELRLLHLVDSQQQPCSCNCHNPPNPPVTAAESAT